MSNSSAYATTHTQNLIKNDQPPAATGKLKSQKFNESGKHRFQPFRSIMLYLTFQRQRHEHRVLVWKDKKNPS